MASYRREREFFSLSRKRLSRNRKRADEDGGRWSGRLRTVRMRQNHRDEHAVQSRFLKVLNERPDHLVHFVTGPLAQFQGLC